MDFEKLSKLIVAMMALGMFAALAAYIEIKGNPTETIQQQMITAIVAWVGIVVGYYFGSSAGSTAKDKTITSLAAPPPSKGDAP